MDDAAGPTNASPRADNPLRTDDGATTAADTSLSSVMNDFDAVGHDGQFVARECKKEGWKFSGDKHEAAQLAFINFVNARGGDARFASGPGSFEG